MRVTQNGLWTLVNSQLSSINSRTRTLEEQAVTGLGISRPSDAPELVAQVAQLSAGVSDQSVYSTNASNAMSMLDTMDSALGRAHDTLTRAREVAMQMVGDLSTTDERTTAAEEIDGLRATMLETMNSSYAGRYIFAGTAYDTPPFADDGTYAGTTDEPSTRVSSTTWVATGKDGSAVFDGDADVLGALDDLSTALNNDDSDAISAALDALDAALTAVSSARSDVGNDTNLAEDALDVAESLGSELQTQLDDVASADPTETYMKLSEMRNAYTAALQVAASAKQTSLFDML
jgi:flagellar hook-associated protein 3 FlgL